MHVNAYMGVDLLFKYGGKCLMHVNEYKDFIPSIYILRKGLMHVNIYMGVDLLFTYGGNG